MLPARRVVVRVERVLRRLVVQGTLLRRLNLRRVRPLNQGREERLIRGALVLGRTARIVLEKHQQGSVSSPRPCHNMYDK
jgi:hypothetical protein